MSTKSAAKKATKTKEAKLDKENLKRLTARETIYKYPASASSPEARKAFRRQTRQKVKSLNKAIASTKGEDKAKAKAELQKFEATAYA